MAGAQSPDANSGGGDPGAAGAGAAPARPDYIPEKFWDAKAGAARVDDLAKSYGELERSRGKVAEDAVTAKMTELFGKRPEAPDKYEVRVPPKAPEGVVILDKAPAADFKYEPGKAYVVLNPADPLFEMGRQLAHRAGMSQDEFDGLVAQHASSLAVRIPTAEEAGAQRAEIYGKLGENGERRVAHLYGWLKGSIGEDRARALDGLVASPDGLAALEEIMAKAGGARFAASNAGGAASGESEEGLRALMAEPDYRTNPAKQRRVTEGFQRLFPGPAAEGIPTPFAR